MKFIRKLLGRLLGKFRGQLEHLTAPRDEIVG